MHALLKPTKQVFVQNTQQKINMEQHIIIEPELDNQLQRKLIYSHRNNFDWQYGGMKAPFKFLDRDSVEYSMLLASQGDETEARMVRLTLNQSLSLVDPVWGGVYQYSTKDWDSPHHSKTMSNQAGYMRIYALAYTLFKNERYLNAALSIRDYLKNFLLSESGAFYSGQSDTVDAYRPDQYFSLDNLQRRKAGLPTVWKSLYARENGWTIEALACLYECTGDKQSLELALNAASWVIKHRIFPDGGFRHHERDANGPYLADTLAMARAMLQLFKVTQQDKWLIRAINAADFISIYFKQRGAGFTTHNERLDTGPSHPQIDENISLMRFTNLLAHYSDMKRHRGMAKHCLRYLSIEEVATAREDDVGILLANLEYTEHPVEISVFGNPFDQTGLELLTTGLRHYAWYKFIRQFQNLENRPCWYRSHLHEKPAAYIRLGDYESDAIHSPEELRRQLQKLL